MKRALALSLLALAPAVAIASPHARSVPEVASAYSPADSPGGLACGGHLTWSSRVVASRTLRCGVRLLISYGRRSVVATVADRGPTNYSRQLDLGPGTYKALGFRSALAFGVRTVRVEVVR